MLGAFWGSMICVVGLLLAFFVIRQSELSRQSVSYELESGEFTALKLYPLAEESALAWVDDAQFVSTSAVWTNDLVIELEQPVDWFKRLEQPVEWVYRFYSPSLQRILFVIVAPDKEVIVRPHLKKVRRELRIIDPANWKMDNPAAVTQWLNSGGAAWLSGTTEPIVSAQLTMNLEKNSPTWIISSLDSETGQSVLYTVEANSSE